MVVAPAYRLANSHAEARTAAPPQSPAEPGKGRCLVTGIGQNAQMSAPPTVVLRAGGGRRHQRAAVHARRWVGEPGDYAAHGRNAVASLTDRIGQSHQIVILAVRGKWACVPHQLPAARGGDPAGVLDAQIPRVRFRHGGQRPDDRRRVSVHEGQRRHGVVRAPGPAAATGNVHASEAICWRRRASTTRAAGRRPISNRYDLPMADPRSRRGRDMRGPLLPPTVPGWRSRAELFDMAVLEAYEPIERRWQERLSTLDVAVDEIPRIAPKDPDSVQWPPEVIADGPIALARLIPAGVDVRGNATRARIMLFRKPIERRAKDTAELAALLHEVLVAQVATYLGVEPSVIDPTIDDD